jgi:hypothetical protein
MSCRLAFILFASSTAVLINQLPRFPYTASCSSKGRMLALRLLPSGGITVVRKLVNQEILPTLVLGGI